MKPLMIAILITLFSLTAVAGGHSEKNSGKRMEKMIDKLDLNEQQAEQVNSILESKKAERKAIKEQMKALQEQTNEELSQVLTEEQMDKLTSMQEKRRDHKQDKKGKH